MMGQQVVTTTILFSLLAVCCMCTSDDPYDTSPPTITQQPQPTRGYDFLITNDEIRLNCDATGRPQPTFRWIKFDLNGNNSVDVDGNDVRINITKGNLRIRQVTFGHKWYGRSWEVNTTDEGIYQCVAQNIFGSALSRKIAVRVPSNNGFPWVEPVVINAQIGEKVVMNCNPPHIFPPSLLSLYWTMGEPGDSISIGIISNDRVVVDGDINLVFANVQMSDDKNYICNAPNGFIREVKTSPIISLIVNTNNPAGTRPPAWVYRPEITQTILMTNKLKLKCVAEGNPTPAVTWSWDDSINIDLRRIEVGPSGPELVIRDITYDDAGQYSCDATNEQGGAISHTITVIVHSAPFWDPAPPSDTIISPGNSANITCRAGGSPAPMISWLINGKPANESDPNQRTIITSSIHGLGQIIITDAKTSDSAVFQCIARNTHGEELTNTFLHVKAIPAKIRSKPVASYKVVKGTDVKIICKPSGYPHPSLEWIFNGKQIGTGNSKHTIETEGTCNSEGMLTISSLTMEDQGTYICNVSNAYGSDIASYTVLVTIPVEIRRKTNALYEKVEGTDVKMMCKPSGIPQPIVEWTFNGEKITTGNGKYKIETEGSNEGMLTISSLTLEDQGTYICNVSNAYGSDIAAPTVIVKKTTSNKQQDISHSTGVAIGLSVSGILIIILVVVLLVLRRQTLRNRDLKKVDQPQIGNDGYVEYKKNSEGDAYTELGGTNTLGTKIVEETYEDVTDTDGQKGGPYSCAYAEIPSQPTNSNVS